MAEDTVKLTVRLPVQLHRALKERAVAYDVSLNQAVIDTLAELELHVAPTAEETEREKVNRVLREAGLLADTSWMSDLAKELLNGEEPVQHWRKHVSGCAACR